ncbi:DUF2341 domain-containing protein [Telmatocola sphagniphila]|uniref:DUF2341 domain-containing protein n=1 Tax=Telmatocola sphagniphila TaxID=1123043 RepID=UPI001FE667F8|nr:DUF2341 domain-containing protein [Telmatocola sphagniphila]
MPRFILLALFYILVFANFGWAQYSTWKHSGSIYLLTTAEGANLPVTTSVKEFPLLVRLHKSFFDFQQAHPKGEDLRFSTSSGQILAYQIEEWNPKEGLAQIWVRIPEIRGQVRQEIKIYWGKPDAKNESNGSAVFNASNGYVSVWHMDESLIDEACTLKLKDTGTRSTPGVIGSARYFSGQQGLFGGEKITTYPSGSSSQSTEAWFRPEKSNSTIIGWGNEGGGRGSKIRMQLRSPPHLHIDSDFSDVNSDTKIPLGEWTHVVHTYEKGQGKIYLNGRLEGSSSPRLDIKNPSRFWIGGWYHNYDYVGAIDEVRISRVARSADWIYLQYENQKPTQTLVGPIVQSGNVFRVFPNEIHVQEGTTANIRVEAGGAQKLIWIEKRNGKERVVATDRFELPFVAGRVRGDAAFQWELKAIYPDQIKTISIPVKVQEATPEPVFQLQSVANWNGRDRIEVVANIQNSLAMETAGANKLNYRWTVSGIATTHEIRSDRLILKRAHNSGVVNINLALDNGGPETSESIQITVKEPKQDAWIDRKSDLEEKPMNGQFYARNPNNEGTLFYNGKLTESAESVFLKLYAEDRLIETLNQKPNGENRYAFTVKLPAGLVKYRVDLGIQNQDQSKTLESVNNIVCGDAFIIMGQSNAVATDFGKEEPTYTSDWIRTFGSMSGSPEPVAVWGRAVHRSRDAEKLQIGYWGMELGRRLVEAEKVPVFLINGAVGGTRIDQHQRDAKNPENLTTLYGRLLWRVKKAHLTHGIRAVIWHQGENDQGADGPTGEYGWENYRSLFINLAGAWKEDYPNIQNYYLFQIWPKSCSMGINGSDNRLREVQRQLKSAFSNLSVQSTLGIDPPGGCHFPAAGYAEFARLLFPLMERDLYGKKFPQAISAANLQRVMRGSTPEELILEFDQPIQWEASLVNQFYLEGEAGKVLAGEAKGSQIVLKVKSPSPPRNITYLDSKSWSQKTLLKGTNGIAALTFCEVPIENR